MGKDCQLYTSRKGDVGGEPNGRLLADCPRLWVRGEIQSACGIAWCTYLVEGMLDDRLAIGVRYAGKQIPYSCVSLLVNVLLPLWNGLRPAGLGADDLNVVMPESRAGLFHDGLPDVVARSVQVRAEFLGKPINGLEKKRVREGITAIRVVDRP